MLLFFFFQAEDGIRDWSVTGVQTCALPICPRRRPEPAARGLHYLDPRAAVSRRRGGAAEIRRRPRRRRHRGRAEVISAVTLAGVLVGVIQTPATQPPARIDYTIALPQVASHLYSITIA